MNIKQISKEIQSKDGEDLTNYCFKNAEDLGLFILSELLDRYRDKKELDVAFLISALLIL